MLPARSAKGLPMAGGMRAMNMRSTPSMRVLALVGRIWKGASSGGAVIAGEVAVAFLAAGLSVGTALGLHDPVLHRGPATNHVQPLGELVGVGVGEIVQGSDTGLHEAGCVGGANAVDVDE